MFSMFYNEYGFQILLCIAVISLILIFLYNAVYGKRGTFTNYSQYMWNLFNKTFTTDAANRNATASLQSRDDGNRHYGFVSRGEMECKRAVESITGKTFTKCRPSFLRNSVTESNLELDCYNDELKIAVEYNGEQHYNFIPYFHKTKDAFYNIKYRDEIKKRLCFENAIRLIVVPYDVKLCEIESFIRNAINL